MRKAGEHAIAPVWEANHVWLIVALVILFVGFPDVHVALTTYLHIPLLLMLGGIIVHGTAFTFRYYDVGDDPPAQRLWSILFRGGSTLVPLVFGHLAASLSRGKLPTAATGVVESYVLPWVGWYPLMVGIFTVNLFAWLAAVFLVGETAAGARHHALARARRCAMLFLLTSSLVAVTASLEGVPWFVRSLHRPLGYICGGLVVAAWLGLWLFLPRRTVWLPRLLIGVIVTSVLGGYWGLRFPVALEVEGGSLQWADAAAEPATLDALATTLCAGALLIIPSLVCLYRLFKRADPREDCGN